MDSRTEDTRNARMRDRAQTEEAGNPPHRRSICPLCKRSMTLPTGESSKWPRFFPFCSERCKLIDLGAWFDADYRIPAKPDEESEEAVDPGPGIDHEPPTE
jgi:endogenous inhibitor of DNA gyrase (YacG/DUF329 family)